MWCLDAWGIDGAFWLVDDSICVLVKMIKHFLFIYAYTCRLEQVQNTPKVTSTPGRLFGNLDPFQKIMLHNLLSYYLILLEDNILKVKKKIVIYQELNPETNSTQYVIPRTQFWIIQTTSK